MDGPDGHALALAEDGARPLSELGRRTVVRRVIEVGRDLAGTPFEAWLRLVARRLGISYPRALKLFNGRARSISRTECAKLGLDWDALTVPAPRFDASLSSLEAVFRDRQVRLLRTLEFATSRGGALSLGAAIDYARRIERSNVYERRRGDEHWTVRHLDPGTIMYDADERQRSLDQPLTSLGTDHEFRAFLRRSFDRAAERGQPEVEDVWARVRCTWGVTMKVRFRRITVPLSSSRGELLLTTIASVRPPEVVDPSPGPAE